MTDNARRVVLLARAGVASQRLAEVLDEAGCECVLHADPVSVDADAVLAARPQTVLVALDAMTEDVLDHFGDVLSNPSIDVIYEEAELAATREGWDAARWRRHLVAKLHGHRDVLPPASLRATPVAVTASAATVETAADTAPVVDLDIVDREPVTLYSISQKFEAFTESPRATASPLPAETALSEATAPVAATTLLHDWSLDGVYADAAVPEPVQASSGFNAFDPVMAEADVGAPSTSILAVEGLAGMDQGADGIDGTAVPSMSTALNDDLAALELRIASMTLVDDTPRRGAAEPSRGAVLVLAGIGGPDAVRQLLVGLPSDFARPVLVQQRLEGARYDRLVAQMQRATSLPVKIGEAGATAERGTIYILPEGLGVECDDAGIRFSATAGDILAALPASSSAVLLLSGADPACVDNAMSFGWAGGLVVGQSLDGCYDSAAAAELAARGAFIAKPTEMVRRLLDHWRHEN